MKVKPRPCFWISNAFLIAFFAAATCAGVEMDTLSMYAGPVRDASISETRRGFTVYLGVTTVLSCCCLHAGRVVGAIWPPDHAVDTVVDEDCCNLFTTRCCMNDFTCTDGSKVTIALICKYCLFGVYSLDTCCCCGSTTMRTLDCVNVEVVVLQILHNLRETATIGVAQLAHFFQNFCYQSVYDTVCTTGTIMQFRVC